MGRYNIFVKIIVFIFSFFFYINVVSANTTEEVLNELSDRISNLKLVAESKKSLDNNYPIGSIYITTTNTSPSNILGGEWEAFGEGRTLIGMGSNGITNYSVVEDENGSSVASISSTSNLPKHSHTYKADGTISNISFSGTASISTSTNSWSHAHSIPIYGAWNEPTGLGLCYYANGYTYSVMVSNSSYATSTNGTAGSHTHTITPTGTVSSTFTGTSSSLSSVGSSSVTSFDIRNPYITVFMWKRVS